MLRRRLACLSITFCLAVYGAGGCASDPASPPFTMSVEWGLTDTSVLPADVTSIELETCTFEGGIESCDSFSCTVNALTLMLPEGAAADNCRPREGTEMLGDAPVLIRRDLPTATPVRFELRGLGAGDALAYIGHAGPFVLGIGERRQAQIRMFPVGATSPVSGATVGRFLHTATALPDGRVLIAGGFDRVQTLASCPAELTLVSEARCFGLNATSAALAFDTSTGELEPIRNAMLEARGGHTATALPDGRVLLAGGAAQATLAMIPQGAGAVSGYRMEIFARDSSGVLGGHASFELFDAFLDIDVADAGRDGDVGAGRFLGVAGTASPGALNEPRFMHAAAQIPLTPERVLLVGGSGGTDSASSYEVFDSGKAGGFGVYQGATNRLMFPRPMPGAVGLSGQVWILGGRAVVSNDELGEIWSATPDGDPNGMTVLATDTEFPNNTAGMDVDHPEYALLRPDVAAIDGGERALVVGWYGAHCDPGGTVSVFASDATELCNSPVTPATRTVTVASSTGLTIPTNARQHAFGAFTILDAFEPGASTARYAFSGGIGNAIWGATSAIDVFSGEVDSMGAATIQPGTESVSLSARRVFHTTTGIASYGAVTLGGMTFSTTVDQIFFEDTVEVLYLPR